MTMKTKAQPAMTIGDSTPDADDDWFNAADFDSGVAPGFKAMQPDVPKAEGLEVVTTWLASLEGLEALEKVRALARACGTCLTWPKVPSRPPSGSPPSSAEVRAAVRALVEQLRATDYEAAGAAITDTARAAGIDVSRSHPNIRRERGPISAGMQSLGR